MLKIIVLMLFFIPLLWSSEKDFELYKISDTPSSSAKNSTILIVGGIHGNEPGSYFAPAVFVQHYKISKGSAWVIPALNKPSIIRNSRGIYGDMNRKFKHIHKHDKDYHKVQRLKKMIIDDRVGMVLNLHDGHGFYREEWRDNNFNPVAWGQSSVIDQERIDDTENKYANLYDIANRVSEDVNQNIHINYHTFRVKNTQTKDKNPEQQNSLTFYAISNNKPAFAIETSKNINDLALKVLYQLRTIEAYLKVMDIKFSRDFELNVGSLRKILKRYGSVNVNDNIYFGLSNIKKYLNFMPLKKRSNIFEFSHPLGGVRFVRGQYHLHIGNQQISTFNPQYFALSPKRQSITINIDGVNEKVKVGSSIAVKEFFKVKAPKGFRVNVIGFGDRQDNYNTVYRKNILKHFAIDKSKRTFRIEVYKGKIFVGMVSAIFK